LNFIIKKPTSKLGGDHEKLKKREAFISTKHQHKMLIYNFLVIVFYQKQTPTNKNVRTPKINC